MLRLDLVYNSAGYATLVKDCAFASRTETWCLPTSVSRALARNPTTAHLSAFEMLWYRRVQRASEWREIDTVVSRVCFVRRLVRDAETLNAKGRRAPLMITDTEARGYVGEGGGS